MSQGPQCVWLERRDGSRVWRRRAGSGWLAGWLAGEETSGLVAERAARAYSMRGCQAAQTTGAEEEGKGGEGRRRDGRSAASAARSSAGKGRAGKRRVVSGS